MGLPGKQRKTYISHKKRWDKKTIVDEAVLVSDYALKNKKEIRKFEALISKYKTIAKNFNKTAQTKESQEAKNFINKLKVMGFLPVEAQSLDEVLDISLRNILDRRLSNILYTNKLARTPKQARQFIVHCHVSVDGRCVSSPSYLVSLAEEPLVGFINNSSLNNEQHPERVNAAGGMIEVEEMEKIPLNNKGKSFDEKEATLDEEEVKEDEE